MSAATLSFAPARTASRAALPRLSCPVCRRPTAARPRRALQVRASGSAPKPVQQVAAEALDLFLKRYDVVSTGVGALAVTAFCVARGQDPMTALSITFGATIMGLVLNEVLFSQDS